MSGLVDGVGLFQLVVHHARAGDEKRLHHDELAERLGKTITIAVIGEDLPEAQNRVTLDEVLTDSNGIPAPKISYTMSENSNNMMQHGIGSATEVLKAAGARDVMVQPLLRPAGWHLMGTAKMGDNASNSVVDGFGRSHDVRNLFIIDGSIFVTAGAVNPTSTIQAMALYIADYFKKNSRHLLG